MKDKILIFIKDNSKLIVGIVIFVLFFAIILQGQMEVEKLHKDKAIGSALIEGIKPVYGMYGGDCTVTYKVIINDKIYIGEYSGTNSILKIRDTLVNRYLPVVYQKSNPNNNKLLLAPYDFHDYGVKYPDSLEWLRIKCFPQESTL